MRIYNNSGNPTPKYGTTDAAGLDLSSKDAVLLHAGARTLVGTGVYAEIPTGYVGLLVPRSSLSKRCIYMTNSVGIIDADYRGEIMASLIYSPPSSDLDTGNVVITKGERIVQLVIVPYLNVDIEEVEALSDLKDTARGEGGFGSTGK